MELCEQMTFYKFFFTRTKKQNCKTKLAKIHKAAVSRSSQSTKKPIIEQFRNCLLLFLQLGRILPSLTFLFDLCAMYSEKEYFRQMY